MKLLIGAVILFMASAPLAAQVHKDSAHHKEHIQKKKTVMSYEIPSSLKEEHKLLHESLEKFTRLPGKTGAASKEVAKALHPHFTKEEEYALPPLGMLTSLSAGKTTEDMKPVIALSEKLKKDLDQMLAEHREIVTAVEALQKAAREENLPEVMRFTESLKLHAKTEEEVLYPAAILIGDYVRMKLQHH